MNLKEAILRYGEIVEGKWADEPKWMASFYFPSIKSWFNTAAKAEVTKIYMNREFYPYIFQAFKNLSNANLLSELKTFDGCFGIRDVRGEPGTSSSHSYGLAIDINASENPLGAEPKLSPEFVKCFKDAGLVWGGDFKRKDGMHFSIGW